MEGAAGSGDDGVGAAGRGARQQWSGESGGMDGPWDDGAGKGTGGEHWAGGRTGAPARTGAVCRRVGEIEWPAWVPN